MSPSSKGVYRLNEPTSRNGLCSIVANHRRPEGHAANSTGDPSQEVMLVAGRQRRTLSQANKTRPTRDCMASARYSRFDYALKRESVMRTCRDRRTYLELASVHRRAPQRPKRTPAVADTKAGAIDCGNRKTSEKLNSTLDCFDAIKRYTVEAYLCVEVWS